MQIQVEEIQNEALARTLRITIPDSELQTRAERHLQKTAPTLKVPGFRPGKVPMSILKQKYGKAAMADILRPTTEEAVSHALKEANLVPAYVPELNIDSFDEGKDLVCSVQFEIMPEIALMDLTTIALERKIIAKPTPETVQERLSDFIRTRIMPSEPLPEARKVQKGDQVSFDVTVFDADKERIDSLCGENETYIVGENSIVPELAEAFVGRDKGEDFALDVILPAEFKIPELAGKSVHLDVSLRDIRIPVVENFTDSHLEGTQFETIEALSKLVQESLLNHPKEVASLDLRKALFDILDENHVFPAPKKMLDTEYERILSEEVEKDGLEELSAEETEELRQIVNRRVRMGLVLQKIGAENNLTVTVEELRARVEMRARAVPGYERQIFDMYSRNKNLLETLRAEIFEDKVVDFILARGKVTDKDVAYEAFLEEMKQSEDKEAQPDSGSASEQDKQPDSKKKKASKADSSDTPHTAESGEDAVAAPKKAKSAKAG